MRRLRIYDALREFRKKRGYAAILDRSAIADSAIILAGHDVFINAETEFVNYYNTGYSKTLPQ